MYLLSGTGDQEGSGRDIEGRKYMKRKTERVYCHLYQGGKKREGGRRWSRRYEGILRKGIRRSKGGRNIKGMGQERKSGRDIE